MSGRAYVVITTSRYSRATVEHYQAIFQRHGSKGSALTIVPFNQASKQDVEALIGCIYTLLGMDLDCILPFAALPENGHEMDGLDGKSGLAHRIMLVNILRLMGAVRTAFTPNPRFLSKPSSTVGALGAGVNTSISPVPSLGGLSYAGSFAPFLTFLLGGPVALV